MSFCDVCNEEVTQLGPNDDGVDFCENCDRVVEGRTHGSCEWCPEPAVLWTGEGWLCEKHHYEHQVDLACMRASGK